MCVINFILELTSTAGLWCPVSCSGSLSSMKHGAMGEGSLALRYCDTLGEKGEKESDVLDIGDMKAFLTINAVLTRYVFIMVAACVASRADVFVISAVA